MVFEDTIPKYLAQGYDCFAIADTRYPNEVEGVHANSGVVVRIDREGVGVTAGKEHSSETALRDYNKFDFIIPDGSQNHKERIFLNPSDDRRGVCAHAFFNCVRGKQRCVDADAHAR